MALRELMPWRWGGAAARTGEGERHPMDAFHQELDRMFDDLTRGFGRPARGFWGDGTPRIDESEDDEAIHVTAELPGMEEKDVEVVLSDGYLTIRGEKKEEKEEKAGEGQMYHRRERVYGSFSRVIPIPAGIDEGKIAASFSKGVLHVDLPKTEEVKKKTRRIEVKSAT